MCGDHEQFNTTNTTANSTFVNSTTTKQNQLSFMSIGWDSALDFFYSGLYFWFCVLVLWCYAHIRIDVELTFFSFIHHTWYFRRIQFTAISRYTIVDSFIFTFLSIVLSIVLAFCIIVDCSNRYKSGCWGRYIRWSTTIYQFFRQYISWRWIRWWRWERQWHFESWWRNVHYKG